MLHYKQILLATDLSQSALPAAERAAEIAKNCKAKLSIIHVIEHSPLAYGGEFTVPIDINLEQEVQKNAEESLELLAEKIGVPQDNLFLDSGMVKVVVLNKADELKADLIIVGTHGHHGIDMLLGSRANAILHHAKCDVLAVRTKN